MYRFNVLAWLLVAVPFGAHAEVSDAAFTCLCGYYPLAVLESTSPEVVATNLAQGCQQMGAPVTPEEATRFTVALQQGQNGLAAQYGALLQQECEGILSDITQKLNGLNQPAH